MIGRLDEFTHPESSAYIRFVAPYFAYAEFIQLKSFATIIFGTGPGTVDVFEGITYTFNEAIPLKQAHSLAFIKLLIEYGLLGGTAFILLIVYSFFAHAHNKVLAFCMFVNYAILSGALLEAVTFYLCYIIGMMFTAGDAIKQEEESEVIESSEQPLNNLYLIEQRR